LGFGSVGGGRAFVVFETGWFSTRLMSGISIGNGISRVFSTKGISLFPPEEFDSLLDLSEDTIETGELANNPNESLEMFLFDPTSKKLCSSFLLKQ
jgi:hypothetical protein